MKNFRTYDLAVSFYRTTKELELKGDARDQLQRASRSIILNLAEGRARRTLKDQLRFFNIAMGSLRESQALLELENLAHHEATKTADKVAAALYLLIKNAR